MTSIEISKQLYEVSGWDTGKSWNIILGLKPETYVPAYDSDYLLEKLPQELYEETRAGRISGSNAQRYKQCGNAVTVNVVEHVVSEMFNPTQS